MKYMGSKSRIAKDILPIILKNRTSDEQYYVEPFCGGCNLIDKVKGNRIASDINYYLMCMWYALEKGWIPPKEITRDFYNECRQKAYNKVVVDAHIIGYVGFNGSYGGRFYDGGFAGISQTNGGERNYPLESYNNVMKQVDKIKGITFKCCSYNDLQVPYNSIIYCDIPYKNTKQYIESKDFDYEKFYSWCRNMKEIGHEIFVSEYEMPEDFKCVWQKEVKSSLSANGKIGGNKTSIEKLFTL